MPGIRLKERKERQEDYWQRNVCLGGRETGGGSWYGLTAAWASERGPAAGVQRLCRSAVFWERVGVVS